MSLQGSEVLSQDGTLSLQEVKYENVGEYKCVGAVPSVPGLTSEASVNLTVKGNGASTCRSCITFQSGGGSLFEKRGKIELSCLR